MIGNKDYLSGGRILPKKRLYEKLDKEKQKMIMTEILSKNLQQESCTVCHS